MFKLIKRLLFGLKVREYVDTHTTEFINPPSNYSYRIPTLYHVVYKCYNSKRPADVWYEVEASGIVKKIQPDLYIHKKKFCAI